MIDKRIVVYGVLITFVVIVLSYLCFLFLTTKCKNNAEHFNDAKIYPIGVEYYHPAITYMGSSSDNYKNFCDCGKTKEYCKITKFNNACRDECRGIPHNERSNPRSHSIDDPCIVPTTPTPAPAPTPAPTSPAPTSPAAPTPAITPWTQTGVFVGYTNCKGETSTNNSKCAIQQELPTSCENDLKILNNPDEFAKIPGIQMNDILNRCIRGAKTGTSTMQWGGDLTKSKKGSNFIKLTQDTSVYDLIGVYELKDKCWKVKTDKKGKCGKMKDLLDNYTFALKEKDVAEITGTKRYCEDSETNNFNKKPTDCVCVNPGHILHEYDNRGNPAWSCGLKSTVAGAIALMNGEKSVPSTIPLSDEERLENWLNDNFKDTYVEYKGKAIRIFDGEIPELDHLKVDMEDTDWKYNNGKWTVNQINIGYTPGQSSQPGEGDD